MFAKTDNSGSEDRRHKNSGAENILFSKFIKKFKCKKGSFFNSRGFKKMHHLGKIDNYFLTNS